MNKPLLAVVGETASGKSSLALDLAIQFNGELICADSWTVYKGFDIGTAKPSAVDLARVPHHLLDIASPSAGFSAVEFQKQAQAAIDDIISRGKLPIMVGGTGLYIDCVLYEYQFLPAPPDGVRAGLDAMTLEELQYKAYGAGLDIAGIDMQNKRRVIRLIENDGARPTRSDLRDNSLVLGIAVDREHLRQRVTQRVDAMLEAGLEAEVKALSAAYGWGAEPMKGIGYREWQPYFEPLPEAKQDLEQTRQRIISATMGLAKRQRTWFKRELRIQWLPPLNTKAEAVDLVTTFISK